MKKSLIVPALLFLLAACTPPELPPGGNLPYRVWQSWDEMKEVLGDRYLYPTYLPEVAERSERLFLLSIFNNVDRELDADELFYGYTVFFRGGRKSDSIALQARDLERQRIMIHPVLVPHDGGFQENDRFNKDTITIGGVDIEFVSFYAEFPPPDWSNVASNEWFRYHARNGRAVLYAFKIDDVTYEMSWVQFDVEDKYADDEQREVMLRVAKSIIEQMAEVECL